MGLGAALVVGVVDGEERDGEEARAGSALETLRLRSGRAECPTPGNGRGGNGGWEGGACLWPGGPIPLGDDGAYEGLCDSWDSFSSAPPKADFQLGGCSTFP